MKRNYPVMGCNRWSDSLSQHLLAEAEDADTVSQSKVNHATYISLFYHFSATNLSFLEIILIKI